MDTEQDYAMILPPLPHIIDILIKPARKCPNFIQNSFTDKAYTFPYKYDLKIVTNFDIITNCSIQFQLTDAVNSQIINEQFMKIHEQRLSKRGNQFVLEYRISFNIKSYYYEGHQFILTFTSLDKDCIIVAIGITNEFYIFGRRSDKDVKQNVWKQINKSNFSAHHIVDKITLFQITRELQ